MLILWGWVYSSVVEHLLSMGKYPGPTPIIIITHTGSHTYSHPPTGMTEGIHDPSCHDGKGGEGREKGERK